MIEQLLRGAQVAEVLGVSKAYAYQMMRLGRIPSVRIGRSIRVRPSDLETFITINIVAEMRTTKTVEELALKSNPTKDIEKSR
jgi:excisionase family DNA binding protein